MGKFLAILLFAVSGMVYGQQQSSSIEPKDDCPDFTMKVRYMYPRKFSMKALTSDYAVSVKNDSLECYLPYMGEVYRPVLNNDGLNFKVPIQGVKVKVKKNRKHVYYRVRKASITYDFHFVFYFGGKGTLVLTPSNAQNCSYEGDWERL